MNTFSLMRSSAFSKATVPKAAPKAGSFKVAYLCRNFMTRASEEGASVTPVVPSTSAPSVAPVSGPKPVTVADVMNFGGSAPEITNGRLAMLGFVAALGAELSTGESVLRQLGDGPDVIGWTFVIFIAASLVPAFKDQRGDSFGPLTPNAELINGRAAMLGFAALLITEAMHNGAALF